MPFQAPLYWDAYEYNIKTNGFIPENVWAANIDWAEKNLKPYGYRMVCIDGWGDDRHRLNQDGYRTAHAEQWTHDYAWWSKNLRARGMQLGIYNNPLWISEVAARSGVKIKGTDIPLSTLINEDEKATWFKWVQVSRPGAEQYVKGYIQYYADIGIKYLRVDFLSWFETGQDRYLGVVGPQRPHADYETALRWMREACDKNGMFLSLVMPNLTGDAEIERRYGDMIRIDEDAGDGGWGRWSDNARGRRRAGWSQYANAVDGLTYWSSIAGRRRIILDPDFLRLNTFAGEDEKKSVISLCLMAGAPVTVADQYSTVGNNLQFYQNREILALNHDGFVGHPLTHDLTDERSQIWTGRLSDGDWVVGLFNREADARPRSIAFSLLGFPGPAAVRDLWQHKSLGQLTRFGAVVPPHGCRILRLSLRKPRPPASK